MGKGAESSARNIAVSPGNTAVNKAAQHLTLKLRVRLNQLPCSVVRTLIRESAILRAVSIAKSNVRSLKDPTMHCKN